MGCVPPFRFYGAKIRKVFQLLALNHCAKARRYSRSTNHKKSCVCTHLIISLSKKWVIQHLCLSASRVSSENLSNYMERWSDCKKGRSHWWKMASIIQHDGWAIWWQGLVPTGMTCIVEVLGTEEEPSVFFYWDGMATAIRATQVDSESLSILDILLFSWGWRLGFLSH